jgi:hypothetical protein
MSMVLLLLWLFAGLGQLLLARLPDFFCTGAGGEGLDCRHRKSPLILLLVFVDHLKVRVDYVVA